MANKEIKVPIPQAMIDEAAKGEVTRLTRKVASLEKKLTEMKGREDKVKQVLVAHEALRDYVADNLDLYRDPYDEW
jgi:hypothetical protein